MASDAAKILLQKLPLFNISRNSRNYCLQRHSSCLHHLVVPIVRNTQNLSALRSRSHSQSYDLLESFELKLLISLFFLSLRAKHKEIRNATKQESNYGRERCEEKFICASALSVPGTFMSMPTVEAFPFRFRAKFLDSKNL